MAFREFRIRRMSEFVVLCKEPANEEVGIDGGGIDDADALVADVLGPTAGASAERPWE
jgi:hypothetical protein